MSKCDNINCPHYKTCNPSSGRCILKSGKLGQSLIHEKLAEKSVKKSIEKSIKKPIKKPINRLVSHATPHLEDVL